MTFYHRQAPTFCLRSDLHQRQCRQLNKVAANRESHGAATESHLPRKLLRTFLFQACRVAAAAPFATILEYSHEQVRCRYMYCYLEVQYAAYVNGRGGGEALAGNLQQSEVITIVTSHCLQWEVFTVQV